MGAVYRGRAPDGRDVAVKVITGQATADLLARFERERRLLAELGEQAGFVPLVDAGSSPTGPYLVMPFLAGGSLRGRIAREPLPVAEAVFLAKRLARALGRAHAKGIVHRD